MREIGYDRGIARLRKAISSGGVEIRDWPGKQAGKKAKRVSG